MCLLLSYLYQPHHQSINGSSSNLIGGDIVSESGYFEKQLVSSIDLNYNRIIIASSYFNFGTYGAGMLKVRSLAQFIPLKNRWDLISLTPFLRLPYLLDKSACSRCFTKLFAFLELLSIIKDHFTCRKSLGI